MRKLKSIDDSRGTTLGAPAGATNMRRMVGSNRRPQA